MANPNTIRSRPRQPLSLLVDYIQCTWKRISQSKYHMILHVVPKISILGSQTSFGIDTPNTFLDLMNNIFEIGDFPSIWKSTIVIPIPKPGKDHFERQIIGLFTALTGIINLIFHGNAKKKKTRLT